MTKAFIPLLLAAVLAQDDPIAAAALKGFRHPWSEFGEGCTVTYRETIKRPEIDDGGNLVLKDVVSQMVWTVESTDGAKAVLKIEKVTMPTVAEVTAQKFWVGVPVNRR